MSEMCVCVCLKSVENEREKEKEKCLHGRMRLHGCLECKSLDIPYIKMRWQVKSTLSSWVCILGRELDKRDGDLGFLCLSP